MLKLAQFFMIIIISVSTVIFLYSCDNKPKSKEINENGMQGTLNQDGSFSGIHKDTGLPFKGKVISSGLTGNTVEVNIGGETHLYENKTDILTGKQTTTEIPSN